MFDEDQMTEVVIHQNQEPPEHNVKRATRARTESIRLVGYDRFPDQAVDVDGDLIEEVMIMVESEPVDLDKP